MANPPIVIGSFDNVPAPGSPLKSDWPQEISNYVQALPRGRIAHAHASSAQSGITAVVDITGCSVSFTAVAGRYYRTTLTVPYILQSAANALITVGISTGAGTPRSVVASLAAGEYGSMVVELIENNIAGAVTRKGTIGASAGSCATSGNTWNTALIVVQDLGTTLPT